MCAHLCVGLCTPVLAKSYYTPVRAMVQSQPHKRHPPGKSSCGIPSTFYVQSLLELVSIQTPYLFVRLHPASWPAQIKISIRGHVANSTRSAGAQFSFTCLYPAQRDPKHVVQIRLSGAEFLSVEWPAGPLGTWQDRFDQFKANTSAGHVTIVQS